MIVIRVELHSAVTGEVTELARAIIANTGTGTAQLRDYKVTTLRGRSRKALDSMTPERVGRVTRWPSERVHVWNLVAEMLAKLGYGRQKGVSADV